MLFRKSGLVSIIDEEIARNLGDLPTASLDPEVYQSKMEILRSLYRMKEEEKSTFGSRDTVTTVFGNLLGILMIVKHEHVNVLTSRAMQLIRFPNVKV